MRSAVNAVMALTGSIQLARIFAAHSKGPKKEALSETTAGGRDAVGSDVASAQASKSQGDGKLAS